jgi:hypothetical protein
LRNRIVFRQKTDRFLLGQVLVGAVVTALLTYFSLAIADHQGTPELIRYLFSPGFVLGMRFAWGTGFWDRLASFMWIALTVNSVYYGLIGFLFLRRFNWPRLPRNPRHRFWMER